MTLHARFDRPNPLPIELGEQRLELSVAQCHQAIISPVDATVCRRGILKALPSGLRQHHAFGNLMEEKLAVGSGLYHSFQRFGQWLDPPQVYLVRFLSSSAYSIRALF